MPQKSDMLGKDKKEKPNKSSGASPNTLIIAGNMVGPTVSGNTPDLNEDHMDNQMRDKDLPIYPHHQVYWAQYPQLEEHFNIIKESFYKNKALRLEEIHANDQLQKEKITFSNEKITKICFTGGPCGGKTTAI